GPLDRGPSPWRLRRTRRALTPPPSSPAPTRPWLKTWPGLSWKRSWPPASTSSPPSRPCESSTVGQEVFFGLVRNHIYILYIYINIYIYILLVLCCPLRYEWQGKIEEDTEVLLMIKTRSSKVPALAEYVRSNHPYEVAEVISLPIDQGNPPYLKWIGQVVPE
uniref:CutA divalent cation tolerance homolog n=1 Tax=Gasterosteus aculeatus aculeatus TaxID=481459 RepID=G3NAQ6_GASAC